MKRYLVPIPLFSHVLTGEMSEAVLRLSLDRFRQEKLRMFGDTVKTLTPIAFSGHGMSFLYLCHEYDTLMEAEGAAIVNESPVIIDYQTGRQIMV